MGSPPQRKHPESVELPTHEVEVGAFWMSKYEVTWALFDEWLWAAAHQDKLPEAEREYFKSQRFRFPFERTE